MHNSFIFHEILANDPTVLVPFYQSVFNWTFSPAETSDDLFFLISAESHSTPFAILSGAKKSPGFEPGTLFYIQVESIDAFDTKAKALGATCLLEKFSSTLLHQTYTLAVYQDPQHNLFGVMEPLNAAHASAIPPTTTSTSPISFNEIISEDAKSLAENFYHELFSWTIKDASNNDAVFFTLNTDGKHIDGGIAQTSNSPGYNKLNSFYIQVENCDASLEIALEFGASVAMPAVTVPLGESQVRIAMFLDPQGNQLGLISPM